MRNCSSVNNNDVNDADYYDDFENVFLQRF